MMETTRNLAELVIELLDVFGEYGFDDLVEHIWRRDDLEYDDVPEEQVRKMLAQLEKDGLIIWKQDENLISISPTTQLERTESRIFRVTLTKWRATIVGSYKLPDGNEIDIYGVHELLKNRKIEIGSLKREFTEHSQIDFDWAVGGTMCESLWSANRFHIHSYFFEEPFPEIVQYWGTVLPSMQENVIAMLPSAGALMVYSVMRGILKEKHPQIDIRIDELDLRLTGGSSL